MKTKAEKLDLNKGRAARKRDVTVGVSRLAFEALGGKRRDPAAAASSRAESAIRLYLSDKGAGRPAWPYPAFLEGSETQEDVDLELQVDPDLWLQFEAEAGRQGISTQQLVEHAAFYFAAELNAGRITQRILDDLDASETKGEPS
jgi:hypothetical protein